MKKLLLSSIVLLSFSLLKSQSILNISYSPLNPGPMDTIYFYADLEFPSGACPLSNSSSSTVGNTVFANSLHCVGMLQVICNTTDTFMVEPLPVGNYTFDMTISSGAGPVPCSPGIVPNDNRITNFVVASLNVNESQTNLNIEIAPNPSTGIYKLSNVNQKQLIIYDILGNQMLKHTPLVKDYQLDLSAYPEGMFLLKIIANNVTETHRLIKK